MQGFLDNLIRSRGFDPATWPYTQFVYLAGMAAAAFLVINFAAITAGIFSWAERRVAARIARSVISVPCPWRRPTSAGMAR